MTGLKIVIVFISLMFNVLFNWGEKNIIQCYCMDLF